MKKVLNIFLLLAFLTLPEHTFSQCSQPVNPVVTINTFDNYAEVSWGQPSHNCTDLITSYYEVEYSGDPFTPGMGQGTLISPVFSAFVFLPAVPFSLYDLNVWIRTVCECQSTEECCFDLGAGDELNSAWVLATINDITPPCFPPSTAYCQGASVVALNQQDNCGTSVEYISYCGYAFQGFASAPNSPCMLSDNSGVYEWRVFNAPATGTISVNVTGLAAGWGGFEVWNDFGFRLLQGSCNGELVHCEAQVSAEDTVIISDLLPGAPYYIGVWNNNFFYGEGNDCTNILTLCETTAICAPPTEIIVQDETDYSVTLYWNINGSSMWQLEYGPVGFIPGEGLVIDSISTMPYELTGLEAATSYDIYLRARCGQADLSAVEGPLSVQTGVTTSVLNQQNHRVSVFPNPAKDQLNVVHSIKGWIDVELYNAAGKLVIRQQQSTDQFIMDVSSLSGGSYTLRVFNGETSLKSLVLIE